MIKMGREKVMLMLEDKKTYTHCQGIAHTRSFDMGLTPAVGKKLEFFNKHHTVFSQHHENLVNQLCSKVILVFYLTLALCVFGIRPKIYQLNFIHNSKLHLCPF